MDIDGYIVLVHAGPDDDAEWTIYTKRDHAEAVAKRRVDEGWPYVAVRAVGPIVARYPSER